MYVYYDLIDGNRALWSSSVCYAPDSFIHPSECLWMVPGTVDPMED